MTAALIDQLSLTDALLLIGLAGIATKTILEGFGLTRSSKLLRDENRDLVDRNKTLEQDRLERIENELTLTARIVALEAKVKELEARDQVAVLHALAEHETRAQGRADRSEQTADDRHTEAMGSWERIATAIETKGATP